MSISYRRKAPLWKRMLFDRYGFRPSAVVVGLLVMLTGVIGVIEIYAGEKEDQYRKDCLENHGKMIGDTCFMPGHNAVEQKGDGDTAIILTN